MGLKPTTFELEVQHANLLYYGGYAEKAQNFLPLPDSLESDDASVGNIKYDKTEFLLLGTRK